MEVRLLYFAGCPSWQLADERVRQAMAEAGLPASALVLQTVDTPEQAEEFGFRGSPTVLVDGEDRFADPDAPVGLSCRVYRTPDGLAGAPTVEQLVAVLR